MPVVGKDQAHPACQAAVIGHPVAHSQSPALHTAAYRYLGAPITYGRLEVPPAGLPDFVAALRDPEQNWRGVSVTMPHKAAMVPFMDRLDDSVRQVGVLNTVLRDPDGALTGYNTDVAGIVGALRRSSSEERLWPVDADVLGAGGTARAAVVALSQLGVRRLRVHVRTMAKAAPVLELAHRLGISGTAVQLGPPLDSQLLLSTLPAHAADQVQLRTEAGIALDVAYHPWPSVLARTFAAGSGTVVSGLQMLLYQAVEQVRLFAGTYWPAGAAEDADEQRRRRLINVMSASIGLD